MTDLEFHSLRQLGQYAVHPVTVKGLAFCDHYCVSRQAYSAIDHQNLVRAARRKGLSVRTIWSNVVQTLTAEDSMGFCS